MHPFTLGQGIVVVIVLMFLGVLNGEVWRKRHQLRFLATFVLTPLVFIAFVGGVLGPSIVYYLNRDVIDPKYVNQAQPTVQPAHSKR